MTIRSDLEKATGIKAKKNEDAAAFRLRLIEAVSSMDDEDYEALPKAAREWSDDAIEDYKKSRKLEDIPEFPAETNNKKVKASEPEPEEDEVDLSDETEEEGEEGTSTESESDGGEEADDEPDEDDEQEEDDVTHTDVAESTSRKRTAKSKVAAKATKGKAKKAAPAAKPAAKAKKAKVAEGGKGLDFARGILAKDINTSATDLREKVAAAGYEVSDSTLSTGASGFRAAVRASQKAGKLKSNMVD